MNELKANCDEAIMQQDSEKLLSLSLSRKCVRILSAASLEHGFKLALRARGLGDDAFIRSGKKKKKELQH